MREEANGYTRYEQTRIISARALQIALGAPLLVPAKSNELDPIMLARREFDGGKIPITIKKNFPRKLE
ncbi:MAG: DNA-directed RNA polymerase subunit K [archaeon]|nr:MAG: DNA-directed RNA polymerase subunit K [archaeon]